MGGWTVILHVGAGLHSPSLFPAYKTLLNAACIQASHFLQSNEEGSTFNALINALKQLEDSPLTNAGVGSCLNLNGEVELDCSVMIGNNGAFGAVGAVTDLKNPSTLVHKLISENSKGLLPLGRIPPMYWNFTNYSQFDSPK